MESVIYQQDPFYGYKDYDYNNNHNMGIHNGGYNGLAHETLHEDNHQNLDFSGENWDSPPPHNTGSSSSEVTCGGGGDGYYPGGEVVYAPPQAAPGRRKRRRTKSMKNKEEMENQRMTHIAVERNRRRQMNDYLAVLRSLMPPSYAQRGDQASIVGGAINFVKELEQLQQFLEAHKLSSEQQVRRVEENGSMFSNFFTFPQYSMSPITGNTPAPAAEMAVEKRSNVADIEVSMVESHANIKILSRRRPKQLVKMVAGFQSLCLAVLHLNITTLDRSVLYSFSVKVEDECQLTTVNEIATAVHEMMDMIQREFQSNGGQAAT